VTVGSYFSGTVIRWDVEGIDALGHYKVMLDSLGPLGYFFTDRLPGSASLNLRLYTYHITLVPLAIIFLLVCHFYLIHVFNISPLPHEAGALQGEVPREELTATFTDHLRSIIMFSLIYYGAVVILSLINPAPLGAEQVSDITGAKPTWPFLWLYGIENFTGMKGILYGSATLAIILALVPILDRGPSRDPLQRKGILSMGLACLLVMVGLTLYAWIAPPQIHKGHDHDNSASGNQHNSRNEMHDGNEHLDRGTIETEQVHEHNVNQPEAQPSEVGKEVPSHSPTP
jgi:quinol-cytochrome oxidoreductase complex cytochrome b subunit